MGRPPNRPVVRYHDFLYQAESWHKPRRVVAKIKWLKGELFPRVGFLVTNLHRSAEGVVRFYNQRGTAEQWLKEGKNAVKWTRLSCHDSVDNQVRLQLFVLAYNLGNSLRRLALPRAVKHWSLTALCEKLPGDPQGGIKIGAKVVTHARYVIFQMAEVAVPKQLFQSILERIRRLQVPEAAPVMTETTGDNTGEPEGNGGGLFASATKALPKAVSGRITALRQADGALREPKAALNRAWRQDRIIEKAQDGPRHTVIWEMSSTACQTTADVAVSLLGSEMTPPRC